MNHPKYVFTMTQDELRLDGLHFVSTKKVQQRIDVVLAIHGTGDGFFRPNVLDDFGKYFVDMGVDFLRVNTRGSGFVTGFSTPTSVKMIGSAYEKLEESIYDIKAWVQWLHDQGYQKIALLGHSLGAVKSIFAATHPELRAKIEFVVALSAPRLSFHYLTNSDKREEFLKTYEQAVAISSQGDEKQLMQIKFPLRYVSSAANYLEKYSPAEKFNILNMLTELQCPILTIWGSEEAKSNPIFSELYQDVKKLKLNPQSQCFEISHGNHFYKNVREETIAVFDEWYERLQCSTEVKKVV